MAKPFSKVRRFFLSISVYSWTAFNLSEFIYAPFSLWYRRFAQRGKIHFV